MRKDFCRQMQSIWLVITAVMLAAILFPTTVFAASNSPYYETVLEQNRARRNVAVDPSLYLEMNDVEYKNLSDQIVQGIDNDYGKVQAIHDWICENIYYDYPNYLSGIGFGMLIVVNNEEEAREIDNMSSCERLLKYRRGICSYYAAVFSKLVRAQGIPCMTVGGYAENSQEEGGDVLIDQIYHTIRYSRDKWNETNSHYNFANHVWNEAYVNNRWIIIDVTWDCGNKYIDGQYIKGSVTQSYFDISEKEFAKDHKIIEYGEDASTVTQEENDGAASKGSITLDTANYIMAPGNIYDIGVVMTDAEGNRLTGEQVNAKVIFGEMTVRDSRTGSIADLQQLPNGNFRVTGKKEGTTYIVYEVGGTHASVRIDVQKGAKQHGTAVRNTSYFVS